MSTFQTLALFFAALNVLIIWFLKKAGNYFRKMDKAVGIELSKEVQFPKVSTPFKNSEILYEQVGSINNE